MRIFWEENALDRESRKISEFADPFKENALHKDMTNEFDGKLQEVAMSKTNLIMSGFGPQRSGKTFALLSSACRFSKYRGVPIDIDNVHFTITDMLDSVGSIEKGSISILDEQIHTSGTGSSLEKKLLENVEMVVGQQQLSFFFIAPRDIQHVYHYKIETWQKGSSQPWNPKKSLESQWKYTKSIIFNHHGIPFGYIITTTPNDEKFMKEYDIKKNKFIDAVRESKGGVRYMTISREANGMVADKIFIDEYSTCKNNRLRILTIKEHLHGKQFTSEEMKTLNDKIDYLLNVKNVSDQKKVKSRKKG